MKILDKESVTPTNPRRNQFSVFHDTDGNLKALGPDGTLYILSLQFGTSPTSLTPDNGGSAGSSGKMADATHTHDLPSSAPITQTPNTGNIKGVASSVARSDHQHNIPTGSAISISTSTNNANGSASTFAQSDHTHAVSVTSTLISATSSVGSNAATDTQINSMTANPGAGSYLVIFSGIVTNNTRAAQMSFTVYVNGSALSDSVRTITADSNNASLPIYMSTQSLVTITGNQTIEIRSKTSVGTMTFTNRSMILLKVA